MGKQTLMMANMGSVADQKDGYTIVAVRFSKSTCASVIIRMIAITLTLKRDARN